MALKSTICSSMHHACQNRAHCQIMVSSFKLLSGTAAYPGFAISISAAMHMIESYKT